MRLHKKDFDGAFAKADGFHEAFVVDLSDGTVGGGVFHPMGDVFGVTIGEMGEDVELLFGTGGGDEMSIRSPSVMVLKLMSAAAG